GAEATNRHIPKEPAVRPRPLRLSRRVEEARRVHHARERPMGRDHRGQRRRRRDGGLPARDRRRQGPDARGGPHARPSARVPYDGVAGPVDEAGAGGPPPPPPPRRRGDTRPPPPPRPPPPHR